ncbi:MAG TPA: class I SAM-dependent methyltransferase [Bryobacteraceae bacterium]|nr:class I SAM-dependent methyltransferase [Bryobacteraceae bacterium]
MTSSTQHAQNRNSHGLDQFFASIRERSGLSILDLAGASQANITFITQLGHKLYSDDILRTLSASFGTDSEFLTRQAEPQRAEYFLQQSLDFPDDTFDGALVWDTLQFLAPPLLQLTVDRLSRVLRPGAYMLSFFCADEKAKAIPVNSYRIQDSKTLNLVPRGETRPAQFFNNRAIERLFHDFQSVKFFLTRDNQREVIARR